MDDFCGAALLNEARGLHGQSIRAANDVPKSGQFMDTSDPDRTRLVR